MTSLEELTKQRDEAYLLYDTTRVRIEKARRCAEKMGKNKTFKKIASEYQKARIETEKRKKELEERGVIKKPTQLTAALTPIIEKESEIRLKNIDIKDKQKELDLEEQEENRENIKKEILKLQQDLEKLINDKQIITESIGKLNRWTTKIMNAFFQKVDKILTEEFGVSNPNEILNLKTKDQNEKFKRQLRAFSTIFIDEKSIFVSNFDKLICQEEVKKNKLEKDYQEKNNLLTKFLVENISNLEYLTIQNKEKLEKGKKNLYCLLK